MLTINKRGFSAILTALVFAFMCTSSVWAEEEAKEAEDPFEGKPPLTDQIQEFSNEIAKRVHKEMQELLDKELKVLKKERNKQSYTVEERIAKQEGIIKENPQNADAHYALGEVYDEIRDGANAIVQTQIAEQLYLEQKNKQGLAESRRNLRWYFEKYEYKPEDFLLN